MRLSLVCLLVGMGVLQHPMLGRVAPSPGAPVVGLGGGDNTAPVLQASNLTYLGACYPPAPSGFDPDDAPPNITVKYIAGADRLYSFDYHGFVQEYSPCSDVNLKTSPPFNTGTSTQQWADIFGTNIFSHQGGPSTSPDTCCLANSVGPTFLSAVDNSSEIYWGRAVGYETSGDGLYDTGAGRGTIDRIGGGAVSEGMWALAYRATIDTPNDTIDDSLVNVGNRWISGIVPVPAWFQAYTGGKSLAAGFGNPSTSTANQGPISYGLSLFAFSPTALGATTNRGILGGANLTKLAHIPAGLAGNVRMSHGGITAYQVHDWAHENTLVDSSTDKMVWPDTSNGGVWIDETFAQAVAQPYIITAGTMVGTITASSAYNVFTVDNIGDAMVNDLISLQTTQTVANGSDYPWAKGIITNISGNTITLDTATFASADFCAPPTCPGIGEGVRDATDSIVIGGWAHEGSQYFGGGSRGTRSYVVLYIFDPADLKAIALHTKSPSSINPKHIYQMPLAGLPQPFNPGADGHAGAGVAAAYSPTTHRLYVFARYLYNRGINDGPALVHVFQLGS